MLMFFEGLNLTATYARTVLRLLCSMFRPSVEYMSAVHPPNALSFFEHVHRRQVIFRKADSFVQDEIELSLKNDDTESEKESHNLF